MDIRSQGSRQKVKGKCGSTCNRLSVDNRGQSWRRLNEEHALRRPSGKCPCVLLPMLSQAAIPPLPLCAATYVYQAAINARGKRERHATNKIPLSTGYTHTHTNVAYVDARTHIYAHTRSHTH